MKRLFECLRSNLYATTALNIVLAMLVYSLCRLEF